MSITGSNNPFACNPVVFANANAIVSLGTITRDGNEFTFSVGFVWKINGVTYQNTSPVVLTINEATTGFQRIDNALLNTSNTIELQQGLESETIALQPVAPDTNIVLTSWNISGDEIEDTETPIVGTQFKKKSEAAAYNDNTLRGSDAVIPLQPNGQSVYAFSNAGLTSIDGFGLDLITGNPSAEVPYDGKDILIYNNKAGNITLKHDGSGTADVKFLLEGSVDLVIPAGGKVWLKYYGPSYCEMIFKSWIDVDLSSKADLVGGKVPASQLPAYVDDVLEFANLASFPTTGESGKIYIAIDTNITYRWTGTGYSEISASLALGETSSTAYRGDRGKIAFDHSQITGNPHGTTKADIGLGNVDNTSDVNKPISIAAQQALNLKQDKLNETNFGRFMHVLGSKTDIKDDDDFIISDSEDSLKSKKTRFLDLKTKLKSYFDTFYLSLSIFNDFVTAVLHSLDNKLDKDTTAGVERVYTINADGSQGTKATSDFKDVLEFANLASFPTTGESGKIYLALDTNFIYRWSGSVYVKISENKKATITVELISQLTTNFYAPNALRINSTELISGSGTLSLKVNDIAYTLGNLISQGAKITAETTSSSVYNLISIYE